MVRDLLSFLDIFQRFCILDFLLTAKAWICCSPGVELFKKEKYDLIIVDTSGRHKHPGKINLGLLMLDL